MRMLFHFNVHKSTKEMPRTIGIARMILVFHNMGAKCKVHRLFVVLPESDTPMGRDRWRRRAFPIPIPRKHQPCFPLALSFPPFCGHFPPQIHFLSRALTSSLLRPSFLLPSFAPSLADLHLTRAGTTHRQTGLSQRRRP